MSVYFIQAQGLIKIGYSADPERRIAAVLSPFSEGGTILGVVPGDRELEAFFHKKFAAHHSHGEWFRPCDEINALIDAMGGRDNPPKPDKVDERSLVQVYDDKYSEDCADCLQAARRRDPETDTDEFFRAISAWSGVSVRRLKDIHLGRVDSVSGAEYTLCRALGESAGFKPSLVMDGRVGGVFKRAGADLMGGE